MTLKAKKILVRVGEVVVLGATMYLILKNPDMAKRILTSLGAWQLGQFIGIGARNLIKQYEDEEKVNGQENSIS